MNPVTCKVCRYTYGAWRTHCPACSTLSIPVIGKRWSTRRDGVIYKPIGRAHFAFEAEQNLDRGLRRFKADQESA